MRLRSFVQQRRQQADEQVLVPVIPGRSPVLSPPYKFISREDRIRAQQEHAAIANAPTIPTPSVSSASSNDESAHDKSRRQPMKDARSFASKQSSAVTSRTDKLMHRLPHTFSIEESSTGSSSSEESYKVYKQTRHLKRLYNLSRRHVQEIPIDERVRRLEQFMLDPTSEERYMEARLCVLNKNSKAMVLDECPASHTSSLSGSSKDYDYDDGLFDIDWYEESGEDEQSDQDKKKYIEQPINEATEPDPSFFMRFLQACRFPTSMTCGLQLCHGSANDPSDDIIKEEIEELSQEKEQIKTRALALLNAPSPSLSSVPVKHARTLQTKQSCASKPIMEIHRSSSCPKPNASSVASNQEKSTAKGDLSDKYSTNSVQDKRENEHASSKDGDLVQQGVIVDDNETQDKIIIFGRGIVRSKSSHGDNENRGNDEASKPSGCESGHDESTISTHLSFAQIEHKNNNRVMVHSVPQIQSNTSF